MKDHALKIIFRLIHILKLKKAKCGSLITIPIANTSALARNDQYLRIRRRRREIPLLIAPSNVYSSTGDLPVNKTLIKITTGIYKIIFSHQNLRKRKSRKILTLLNTLQISMLPILTHITGDIKN